MATTRREDTSRRGRSPPATIRKEVSTISRARSASRSPSSASRSSTGKAVHVHTKPSGTNRKPALRLATDIGNDRKKITNNTQGMSTGRNLTRNRSMDKPPPSPSSSSQGSRIGQTAVKERTLLKSSTFSPLRSVIGGPAKSPGKKTQQVMSSPRGRSGSGNAVKKGSTSGGAKPKERSTVMIKSEAEVIVPVAEEEEMVIGEAEDLLDSTQLEYQILEELPDPERKDENNPISPESETEEKEEETQQIPSEELEEVEAEKSGGEGANLEEPKVKDVEVVTVSKLQGKKEATAYNDVIEETASRLVEKRKSKVLALVGAFETVISLQEPETPNRLSRPPTPQGVNKSQLPIVTATAADVLTVVHDGAVTDESEMGGTQSIAEDVEEPTSAGPTV